VRPRQAPQGRRERQPTATNVTEDVLRRVKDANRWRVTGDHGLTPQQVDRERRGRDQEQIRPAAHAGKEVDVAVPRVDRLSGATMS
jgi:hypothetical protein